MKGLLKYLSPFAPDQSGASAALFELGGITVICDAGGCTGNICGFDEPRWFTQKSAIFSAGLRDMDAILGRDDKLIEKLKDTAQKVDAGFAAIIGTPVPAVIATDYKALERMAEKRCNLPVITIECTGTRLYDQGAEEVYCKLFRKFAEKPQKKTSKRILGVIGTTPLDISCLDAPYRVDASNYGKEYDKIVCYGMGSGLDEIATAGQVTRNLVVAPAGIKAAKYMEEQYQIPYEVGFPFLPQNFVTQLENIDFMGKRILVVHQQVAAWEIRRRIRQKAENADVTVATWFMEKEELREGGDFRLEQEDAYVQSVMDGNYDFVIGDRLLKRPLKEYRGTYLEIPHFAVSGDMLDSDNGE